MKYDQQLVDRGWQRMAALLDNEMPHTGKRRRRGIWWIAMIGAALILSGWAYHFSQSSKDKPMPAPQEEPAKQQSTQPAEQKPIAAQEEAGRAGASTVATTGITSLNNRGDFLKDNALDAERKASPTFSNAQQPLRPEQNHVALTPGLANRTGIQEHSIQDAPVFEQNNVTPITSPDIVSESISVGSAVALTEPGDGGTVQITEREEVNILRLPVVATSLANKDDQLTTLAIKPVRPKNFAVNALAATHFNADGNPMYGVEAGLQVVWPANRRLKVQGGVSYGYYNVDGIGLGGVFQLDSNADAENLSNGQPDPSTVAKYDVMDVIGNSLEYNESRQLTEKFNYLHFPISLEYCLTPRLSASVGVKLSALLSAPARYQLDDARFNASTAQISGTRSFLYNYDIVKKMDVAPMLSVSYMLAHHLWIDVAYTYGLMHYINTTEFNTLDASDRNDYHRTASVGVRYNFL